MTQPLAIDGIGVVGGFGSGLADLRAAIEQPPGPNGSFVVDTSGGPREYPAYRGNAKPLQDWIDKRKLRRVGGFSRLATLAAALALDSAGMPVPACTDRCGVIVVTGYGALAGTFRFLDTMIDGAALASPTEFSNSVHSVAASDVTILLQLTGPSLTISQFEMSYAAGLICAANWLAEGRVDSVLLGAVDEVNDLLAYCRHCFFGAGNFGPIRPEALDVDSAIAGEGAAFTLLRGAAGGQGRYGWIRGFGWAAEPPHPPADTAGLVLGADGHRCCGRHYRPLVESCGGFTSFSPLYGTLPSGHGFDLAISALAMTDGVIGGAVECIKADTEGQFARIRLTP